MDILEGGYRSVLRWNVKLQRHPYTELLGWRSLHLADSQRKPQRRLFHRKSPSEWIKATSCVTNTSISQVASGYQRTISINFEIGVAFLSRVLDDMKRGVAFERIPYAGFNARRLYFPRLYTKEAPISIGVGAAPISSASAMRSMILILERRRFGEIGKCDCMTSASLDWANVFIRIFRGSSSESWRG